jgi:hypothetical protein
MKKRKEVKEGYSEDSMLHRNLVPIFLSVIVQRVSDRNENSSSIINEPVKSYVC